MSTATTQPFSQCHNFHPLIKLALKKSLFSSVISSSSNYGFNYQFIQLATYTNFALCSNSTSGDGYLILSLTSVPKITSPYKEHTFSQSGPLYSPISLDIQRHSNAYLPFLSPENHPIYSSLQRLPWWSPVQTTHPTTCICQKPTLSLKLMISDPGNFPDPSNLMQFPNI